MLLKKGSTGTDVTYLQYGLKIMCCNPGTIDGNFGTGTYDAVVKYQTSKGLSADGIVGDGTWNALKADIKNIQTLLNKHGYSLSVDGIAGASTYNAVISFQKSNGLTADGMVGSATLKALNSGGSTSSSKQISDAGAAFIADYESFSATAYRGADSQNLTIGYGHVIVSGDGLNANSVLTKEQALALLKKDLSSRVSTVNSLTSGISLKQCQFDALVSFQFNTGSLGSSTLLKDVKAGASSSKIKEDFLMWVKCNGETLQGLVNRRTDEWEMYANGDYKRTH